MANLQERRDKSGTLISYSVRVHRGRDANGKQLKPFTATFDVLPTWTEKTARKKAEAFAATFEKECREGIISDSRKKFEEYAEYVISLKEERGCKHGTADFYRTAGKRVYPYIGHLQIKDIRPEHLNRLYSALLKDGAKKGGGKLSTLTVRGFHRFISMVLEYAVKEGLTPFAASSRVDLPKIERKTPTYYQPEELKRILQAAEQEPIKWRTMIYLLAVSGCRRGELLGLKWSEIDFEKNQIHICNSVLYRQDIGVYEDTPKTEKSDRRISIPKETMERLKEYRRWQLENRLRFGADYENRDFVFAQDNGKPIHPDSFTTWCLKFGKRHDLPRIKPHAFRHSAASVLYYGGMDSVSISRRLGHAQVSTTADIYAHVIEEADRRSADIMAEMLAKNA